MPRLDSLTELMVDKILSIYQGGGSKDVFDLYCYLSQKPKYNLFQLVKSVEKKFGVIIEPSLLIVKINELSDNLSILSPLILSTPKNLDQRVKSFFQGIFNDLAKKKIK